MKKQFNLKRFLRTFWRELALNKTNILIMIASLTFISLLMNLISQRPSFPKLSRYGIDGFPIVALVYCLIIASSSFSELNFADRKIDFLMLPSSVVEKYIVKFIYTTLGFFLLSISSVGLSAILIESYYYLFPSGTLFRKLMHSYYYYNYNRIFQNYIMFHSIFFFGGIYFRKLELGKTFLTVSGTIATLGIYLSLLNILPFFKNVSTPFDIMNVSMQINENSDLSLKSWSNIFELNRTVKDIVIFCAYNILPIFLWVLSFLRLQENEVSDGV